MKELSPSLEDYLEAVYTLSRPEGFARASRVSALLKVSKPSVSAAMRTLGARGLVDQQRYACIRLTPAGLKAGAEIAGRHSLLKDFFTAILGLEEKKAEQDACRAEHALSREALLRLGRLSLFLKARPRGALLAAARTCVRGRTCK
ncbi:MAG: metal-dependent transcriptional regulator [Elusimicrobiales bacterium]|nr:metal-dependent transcriptional regulator [Elusimicrobiales bacterium]